jgi:hypothetical protein
MNQKKIAFVALFASLIALFGCNLAPVLIETEHETIRDLKFIERHWDPDLFEQMVPINMIQMEGQLEVDPEYENLMRSLMIQYVGYAVYWLDDKIKEMEEAGNFDKAERLADRKGLLLDRATVLMFRMMRLRDEGFDEALASGTEGFKDWVEEHFFTEKDAEVILDAGTAWFANMEASADGLAAAVDRPYAEILMLHSVSINPELENARGLSVLGTVECSVPQAAGGTPQKGIDYLERALKITKRRTHTIQLALAEKCAVEIQDRKMFLKYLNEIIEGGDKAERLLRQIDDLIYEDL